MLKTFGVLAGAYRETNPKSFLTHACEVNADMFATKVLCSRVKLENICDDIYSEGDHDAEPTCEVCATRWRKAKLAR